MIIIKDKYIKILLILIFIIYSASYYISSSGYYEYHIQEKTMMTNEKIKEFEEDVRNNQNIDIKDYLAYQDIDYTNRLTNIVYNISVKGNDIARKVIKVLFKKLSSLVAD